MSDGVKRVAAGIVAACELLAAVPALMFAGFSVMMFDAPGSAEKTANMVAFFAAWTMPVALVVGSGFGIAAAIRFTARRIWIALLLPIAAIVWLTIALAAI